MSPSPRRILTVCTGNVCRSPVAAQVLTAHLLDTGHDVIVSSAGTNPATGSDRTSIKAAQTVGVELHCHVARELTTQLITTDGADFVITMTRQQLREVATLVPDAWLRTFTMKELARRACEYELDRGPSGGFETWRRVLAESRATIDMMGSNPTDDIADPFGRRYDDYLACYEQIEALAQTIASVWPSG